MLFSHSAQLASAGISWGTEVEIFSRNAQLRALYLEGGIFIATVIDTIVMALAIVVAVTTVIACEQGHLLCACSSFENTPMEIVTALGQPEF